MLHRLLLDWHHINERCLEAFSKIFKPGKIIDPEQEPVRFKNGKIKKSSIVKITRSKFYLREFNRFLWIGNIKGALKYLDDIKAQPELLKANGTEVIDSVISYLNNKNDRMTCFALRKELGLRNSSNRVEKTNDLLVSHRQKGKGLSWSDEGSFSNSSVIMIFKNNEVNALYDENSILFTLHEMANDMDTDNSGILSWIGKEVNVQSKCLYKSFACMA